MILAPCAASIGAHPSILLRERHGYNQRAFSPKMGRDACCANRTRHNGIEPESLLCSLIGRFVFVRYQSLGILLICACIFPSAPAWAAQVPVHFKEGLLHGFLVLGTLEGERLADGDLLQTVHGDRVTSRLTYRFKDGSLQDETTIFSQRRAFRLISYHLIEKGPAFKQALDLSFTAATGQVTVRYTDADGKEKEATERMKLPPDLANGMVLTLLKNLAADESPMEVSMVVATPKPRLVKLAISSQGTDPFILGSSGHNAIHYVLKVQIGGLAGLVAPLLGKQPPDSHIWIMGGEAPAFAKSEVMSYLGGPMWRTELAAPVWPKPTSAESKDAKDGKR
jgi:hypothetical protein